MPGACPALVFKGENYYLVGTGHENGLRVTTSIAMLPTREKKQLLILFSTLKAEAAIAPVAGAAAASDLPKFRMILTFSRIILREPRPASSLVRERFKKSSSTPPSRCGRYRKYPAIDGGKNRNKNDRGLLVIPTRNQYSA